MYLLLADVHELQAPIQQQAQSSENARDSPAAGHAPSSASQGKDSSMLPERCLAWSPPSPSAIAAAGASRAAAAAPKAAARTPGAVQPSAPAARLARIFASDTFACPAPPGSLEFNRSKGPYSLGVPILGTHLMSPGQIDSTHPRDSCVPVSKPSLPMRPEEVPLSQSRILSSKTATPAQHEDAQPKKGPVLGTETGSSVLSGDAQAKGVRILGREPGSLTDPGGILAKTGHALSSKPGSSAQPEDSQPRKRRRVRVKVVGPQSLQQPAPCPAAGQPSASPQVCPPAWATAASQPGAAQRPAQVCANACVDAAPAAQPDMAAEQPSEGSCARATDELAARPHHLRVPPQPRTSVSQKDVAVTVEERLGVMHRRQSLACETAGAASASEKSRAGKDQPKKEQQAEHPRPLPSGLAGSRLPGKKLACPPKPSHGRDSPEAIQKGVQITQRVGARAVQGRHADTEMCVVTDLTDELAPIPPREKYEKGGGQAAPYTYYTLPKLMVCHMSP